MSVTPVIAELPPDLDALRQEARNEGLHLLDRLAAEWESGRNRFTGPNEALLAARVGTVLVGMGGLTGDPVVSSALRMRRFYVHPAFRRLGVARRLAEALLEAPRRAGITVTVNAATASAPAFWEALGFCRVDQVGHTHVLRRDGPLVFR